VLKCALELAGWCRQIKLTQVTLSSRVLLNSRKDQTHLKLYIFGCKWLEDSVLTAVICPRIDYPDTLPKMLGFRDWFCCIELKTKGDLLLAAILLSTSGRFDDELIKSVAD
jgi:hypothetical protein